MSKAIGMKSLLAKEDKGLSDAQTIPTKLFRLILLDLNIEWDYWTKQLNRFIQSDRSGLSYSRDNLSRRVDRSALNTARSNSNRSLSYPNLKWNQFRRGLQVLNPHHSRYVVNIRWSDELIHPVEPPSQVIYEGIGSGGELTSIYRQVGMGIELTPQSWNALVSRWINDPKNGVSNNPHEHSTERGNLRQRVLENDQFTWDIFVKAMSIIGVSCFDFCVEIQWLSTRQKKTLHCVTQQI